MIPAPVTDEMVQALSSPLDRAVKRTFIGPTGTDNVQPCEAVVHRSPTDLETAVIRVPMHLEPGELSNLLNGGTLWVSMWGGLAPFAVEVVAPAEDNGCTPHAQKALHQRETEALDRQATG